MRSPLRIGLLHLAPKLGDVAGNEALLVDATRQAAANGADWVVSGELVRSGFAAPAVAASAATTADFIAGHAELTAELDIAAFLHAPLPRGDGTVASTMYAIDRGRIAGTHDKIAIIPEAESWATAGTTARACNVDGTRVGMLVCADAHPPGIAAAMRDDGAEILLSSAAWHSGEWGPAGEWEQRSIDTGLPVIVANRTGTEPGNDFRRSSSVVCIAGHRQLSLRAEQSTVFIIELVDKATKAQVCLAHALTV